MATVPFASFPEVWSTHERVGSFEKAPYRKELAERFNKNKSDDLSYSEIGAFLFQFLTWIPLGICWLLLSPIVLFCQALPARDRQTRVAPSH